MNRLLIFVFLLQIGCSAVGHDRVAADWANRYLTTSERLLCASSSDGHLFFAAISGNRIKTGYRIDVSSESGTPKSLLIKWQFKNEGGASIGAPDNPEVEIQRYERIENSIFAEEVLYRRVNFEGADGIVVVAGLSLYEASDAPPSEDEIDSPQMFFCKAKLGTQ